MSAAQEQYCHYPAPPPPVPVNLITAPPQPCPYLPDRLATLRAFYARQLDGRLYHRFMDTSFRRSGCVIYQPVCLNCRLCMPLRVPVRRFSPSKSQRRCWKRNQDLAVAIGDPTLTEEKCSLYQRYQCDRHYTEEQENLQMLSESLYTSPVPSVEFVYRTPDGRLMAVGICDLCDKALSSVYFFFDPSQRARGLGIFGALCEIEFAQRHGIEHYYLGYWVRGSRKMSYKSAFRPNEILCPDGQWRANACARLENADGED